MKKCEYEYCPHIDTVNHKGFIVTLPDPGIGRKTIVIRVPSEQTINVGGNYIMDKDGLRHSSDHLSLDNGCAHSWKTYIGLHESFEYCTKCDEKRTKS